MGESSLLPRPGSRRHGGLWACGGPQRWGPVSGLRKKSFFPLTLWWLLLPVQRPFKVTYHSYYYLHLEDHLRPRQDQNHQQDG